MPNEFQIDFGPDGNATKVTMLKRNHFVGIYGHYGCGHDVFLGREVSCSTDAVGWLNIDIRMNCPICKLGAIKSLQIPRIAWEEIPNWERLADAILDGRAEITIHEPLKEGE